MKVRNSISQTVYDFSSLILREEIFLLQQLLQVTSFTQLGDQIHHLKKQQKNAVSRCAH